MNKALITSLIVLSGLGYALPSVSIPNGDSGYRVEFTGKPGAKLIGVVGWQDIKNFKKPMHMDEVKGKLPLTILVNPPDGAIVAANGSSLGNGEVTVRIYHNGVECGESLSEGTAKLGGKVCQP
jgi:hypothetical protein